MQSQQKRLKWSRGETAEALEERTDTGITSASVELMENCIPDIYGNISRRPALKPLSVSSSYSTYAHSYAPWFESSGISVVVPFYITENDFILVAFPTRECIRIVDDEIVAHNYLTGDGTAVGTVTSYAQQNNYLLVAGTSRVHKIQFTIGATDFSGSYENWLFSGEWYAPNGTQTKTETSSTISGLMFSGDARNYTYTDNTGNSTVYTSLPTGLNRSAGYGIWSVANTTYYLGNDGGGVNWSINTSGHNYEVVSGTMINATKYEDGEQIAVDAGMTGKIMFLVTDSGAFLVGYANQNNTWVEVARLDITANMSVSNKDSWNAITTNIPAGSIINMPNIGCYFRVEGYFSSTLVVFPGVVFDKVIVLDDNEDLPTGYTTGNVCVARTVDNDIHLEYFQDNVLISREPADTPWDSNKEVFVRCSASSTGEKCGKFWFFGSVSYFAWQDASYAVQDIFVFGSLLTPIADSAATDSTVSVEYGYISLNSAHPERLVFNNQRLWAAQWVYNSTDYYSIVIGSQIGRYNDLKNDYNKENEPVTLDILTQFKEKIVHLIDYNGLKIMTDSYEYAYDGTNWCQKQSANGSSDCEPIIFDSLCLYVDSTGKQVKAMQYEFQSNIFNSSTINQVAPHDLVWYPRYLASYEDKTHSTGKYLFVLNRVLGGLLDEPSSVPCLAVCNFVPGNQANIWSRWSVPKIAISGLPSIYTVRQCINLKNEVLFLCMLNQNGSYNQRYILCKLDFEGLGDYETSTIVNKQVIIYSFSTKKIVLDAQNIDIYSNGEYKFSTTTNDQGYFTDDISQLTNVSAAIRINSTIRSHPIDVGGKTKSIKKRIGKARMSVHGTDAGVLTINGKTGYMNPAKDEISFYGVTGMKNEIKYTITNKNGGMFHLESLLMNIEYGTLDS